MIKDGFPMPQESRMLQERLEVALNG